MQGPRTLTDAIQSTEQFADKPKNRAGKAEKLNLAPSRLGPEDLVQWIKREFVDTLASRRRPLRAGGELVGPKGKVKDRRAYPFILSYRQSIRAMPTELSFRQTFAGVKHRKEWRSFLGAMAYLVKSGKVRAPARPGPGPMPGGGPAAGGD